MVRVRVVLGGFYYGSGSDYNVKWGELTTYIYMGV